MNNQIYPCLWFKDEALEAVRFYCSVFGGNIKTSTPVVITFELNGQKFMCLNGGSQFKPNPTLSFYVICQNQMETRQTWDKLTEQGTVMMPLDQYEWSPLYGWVQDRYGISWQLTWGKISDMGQKFTPALMFTGNQFGKAEEALNFYHTVFKDSAIHHVFRYEKQDPLQGGKIKHSQCSLLGQKFILMDSGLFHDFNFTEGLSLVIDCGSQQEIDYYWDKLSEGGSEGQCGWLKDPFNVSWQIVPAVLGALLNDSARAPRVTSAFLKMKKFNIEKLLQA